MPPSDVLTFLTLLAATIAALGALWAAFEARRTRLAVERSREARAFRLALLEMADAARHWMTWQPMGGGIASGMPDMPLVLSKTREMVARVAFPTEVLSYLIWSTEAVRIISDYYLAVLNDRVYQVGSPSNDPYMGWSTPEGQDLWWAALGRVVDTARVTCAAARGKKLDGIADAFEPLFAIALEREPALEGLYPGTLEPLRAPPPRPTG